MPSNKNKRRCSARTKAGKRCRNTAVRGRDVCCFHAGLNVPGESQRRAGRACTATTTKGRPCRKWAVSGSDPPRCTVHGPQQVWNHPPPSTRRCQALTKQGRRCRAWAARNAPSGQALCSTHAGLLRPPQPRERCTATNGDGRPCAGWAVHGTEQQYGAGLCPAHLPHGDPRKVRGRLPGPDQRRCRALTLHGDRCPHWAMSAESAGGKCWMHAFPHLHPRVTHGYYRRVPHFAPAMQAAILRLAQKEGPGTAQLILTRLKVKEVFAYFGRDDLGSAEMDRVAGLLYKGVRAVMRLVQAQNALAGLNWGPYSAGGTGKMVEQLYRQAQDDEGAA